MVKKGAAVDGDPASKVAAELKRLTTAIIGEEKDEFVLDVIDRAKDVLFTLRDLKASETASLRLDDVSLSLMFSAARFSDLPDLRDPLWTVM